MASGTVGTGGCFDIGIDVVVGREPSCWVDRGWGRLLVRSRGRLLVRIRSGCESWVSLVLISRMLLSGLRSAVQLILQVGYLGGKVLEHLLHVGILLCCLG